MFSNKICMSFDGNVIFDWNLKGLLYVSELYDSENDGH